MSRSAVQRPEGIAAVEIDVDDVLIFLRRVLGVLDRAVRPPLEPVGVLAQPWMIGRALDREIERDLQPVLVRCRYEPAEILQCAELRMDRIVPALVAADRIRAAVIARPRRQRVVAALAVLLADGMDRRKVENVETHLADIGKAADHIVERAVPVHIAGLRARKQLVPARKLGLRPLDFERQRRVQNAKRALRGGCDGLDGRGRAQRLHARLRVIAVQGLNALPSAVVLHGTALALTASRYWRASVSSSAISTPALCLTLISWTSEA